MEVVELDLQLGGLRLYTMVKVGLLVCIEFVVCRVRFRFGSARFWI